MYELTQIVSDDEKRMSGNGFFPAPQNKDIGRKVIITRQCSSWDGSLGFFYDDVKKETYAFYDAELQAV